MEVIIFRFGSTYSTFGQEPSLWFRECVSHLFIHSVVCQLPNPGRRYESEKVKAKVGPLLLLHVLILISDILSCWCDGVYFDPGHFVLRMSKVNQRFLEELHVIMTLKMAFFCFLNVECKISFKHHSHL